MRAPHTGDSDDFPYGGFTPPQSKKKKKKIYWLLFCIYLWFKKTHQDISNVVRMTKLGSHHLNDRCPKPLAEYILLMSRISNSGRPVIPTVDSNLSDLMWIVFVPNFLILFIHVSIHLDFGCVSENVFSIVNKVDK